ncbi:hypothetical protein DAPPUDRAFT_304171 [Daphnia pulex]|uniref:Uncharacterized protein n=1 Tax=Daphnia pulex TaxID=6669 RepID=E9GK51_DAPPU|nr:hypothetical protein DAPPUDRAFT_304171 [Daphnia pulex]|eukprot:EFX80305.1 hypothetical protein DAPPUDRAFT_304171 [Daphnia pulex]
MGKEVKDFEESHAAVQVICEDLPISNFELHWESQFLDISLKDWLKYLCYQNDKAISWHDTLTIDLRTSHPLGESNLSPPSVFGIVYKWCQKLKQPVGVSYRTVELYERFTRSYCSQTFYPKTAVNKSEFVTAKKISFQEIHTELRHQSLLHLVSCLQIASKLENGYKVVTVKDAVDLLQQSKRPSDRSTIVNSEVLVLVTLNHEVDLPPINDFLDTFICQLIRVLKKKPALAKIKQLLLKVDEIHQVSMDFIRAIYFDQQVIIGRIVAGLRLDESAKGLISEKGVYDFHRVQSDKVLLAAGAITAAVFIIQPNAVSDVLRELHRRTGAYPSEVAVVSSLLVDLEPIV